MKKAEKKHSLNAQKAIFTVIILIILTTAFSCNLYYSSSNALVGHWTQDYYQQYMSSPEYTVHLDISSSGSFSVYATLVSAQAAPQRESGTYSQDPIAETITMNGITYSYTITNNDNDLELRGTGNYGVGDIVEDFFSQPVAYLERQ